MAAVEGVHIKSHGTTKVPPVTNGNTSAALSGIAPSPAVTRHSDFHGRGQRRFFLGPMPEKVVVPEVKKRTRWTPRRRRTIESVDETSTITTDTASIDFNHERLFDYFLREGGRKEDWDENVAKGIRDDIRRRWTESKWIGKSFEVGDVLGLGAEALEVLDLQEPQRQASSSTGGASRKGTSLNRGSSQDTTSHPATVSHKTLQSTTNATFVTAPSGFSNDRLTESPTKQLEEHPSQHQNTYSLDARLSLSLHDDDLDDSVIPPKPDSSTTALVHSQAFAERPLVPPRAKSHEPQMLRDGVLSASVADLALTRQFTDGHDPATGPPGGLRPALWKGQDRKGKGKNVNFERDRATPPTAGEEEATTADPAEVLQRTGEDIEDTSAGAAEHSQAIRAPVKPGDVIMKDRVLVKVSYNRSEGLPSPYDEREARRHPDSHEEDWAEFLVCWRHHHLEIYEDYSLPGAEWLMGGKHLAFVVPLKNSRTHISLYSAVDGTFCITCPPTPPRKRNGAEDLPTVMNSKRSVFHRAPSGTNIFVFKCKQRSRAIDWMWLLWREIKDDIPSTIEVHSPDTGSRVHLQIPEFDPTDGGPGYKTITRRYVIDTCRKAFAGLSDWKAIVEGQIEEKGADLELCWRREDRLEWIWLDEDIDGNKRDWAVIFNVAFRHPRVPTRLEIRLASHAQTYALLSDGTKLSEPPAVEGYLYRIRTKRQTRTALYLSSHDGNLFTIATSKANPPAPPAPPTPTSGPSGPEPEDTSRTAELRRAALQILAADGYIDMRNIYAVRRATTSNFEINADTTPHGIRGNIAGVTAPNIEEEFHDEEYTETASDAGDEGGDEYMNNHPDKTKLKMKRQFEFVMRSGHVIRFEAQSCVVALEWISKLKALVSYWTRRHRVDARQEMDLARASGGARSHSIVDETDLVDPGANSPFIGEFWNWCILSGCRPIVKAGRLFEKTGFHKQFKHMYHVLANGHLIQFHLTSTKSAHHHRSHTINLIDAYVYSGQLAMTSLPSGSQDEPQEIIPKRYQDGLEAYDSEEDVTFIIWYRKHSMGLAPQDETKGSAGSGNNAQPARIQPLGSKHSVLVLKARSKLERDSWCFALNAEIERLSRQTATRERRLRETGNV